MEKQTLTPAILGAYMGAMVTDKYSDGKSYKMVGVSEWEGNLQVETSKGETDWWNINQCQLILFPLSKISDEDAVEVAKIMGVIDSDCGVDDYEYWGNYVKKSYINEGKQHRSFIVSVEVIDYLRSRSYDCGHGDIKSLIEAGMAVDGTLLNDKN